MNVRRVLPFLVLSVGLVGAAGCGEDHVANPPATPPPPAVTGDATDFCTLAIQIATESGIMVDKHYIPPLQETLDQLKALVNAALANRDRLVTGLPDDVRAAVDVQLQYFQALKDNDFSSATPVPAGLDAATQTVNQYQVSACGVTFDQ